MKHKIISKLFAFYKKRLRRKKPIQTEQKIIASHNDGIINIIIISGKQ